MRTRHSRSTMARATVGSQTEGETSDASCSASLSEYCAYEKKRRRRAQEDRSM